MPFWFAVQSVSKWINISSENNKYKQGYKISVYQYFFVDLNCDWTKDDIP